MGVSPRKHLASSNIFCHRNCPIELCGLTAKHSLQRQGVQPNLDFGDHPALIKTHVPRIRLIVAHAAVGICIDSVQCCRGPPVLPDNDTLVALSDLELDARRLDQIANFGPCVGAVRPFRRPYPGKERFPRHRPHYVVSHVGKEFVAAWGRLRQQGQEGANLCLRRIWHVELVDGGRVSKAQSSGFIQYQDLAGDPGLFCGQVVLTPTWFRDRMVATPRFWSFILTMTPYKVCDTPITTHY